MNKPTFTATNNRLLDKGVIPGATLPRDVDKMFKERVLNGDIPFVARYFDLLAGLVSTELRAILPDIHDKANIDMRVYHLVTLFQKKSRGVK